MTPAVPPLPTSWNFPFQLVPVGIHTSNCTAGLVTPTTRQIGSATVPTGLGFAPAGSAVALVMVVSGSASAARAAQVIGCAADAAPAQNAKATAATIFVLLVISLPLRGCASMKTAKRAPLRRLSRRLGLHHARVVHDFAAHNGKHRSRAAHVGIAD